MNTVTELKKIAKHRGLKRYSKLRKAELIKLLLDNSPVLKPTPYVPPVSKAPASLKDLAKSKMKGFADWIMNYIPPIPKKPQWLTSFQNKIQEFYTPLKFVEGKSSLKKFARQFKVVPNHKGYDEMSFLSAVKNKAIETLENNTGTKVRMVLKCLMKQIDDGADKQEFQISSTTEENLQGTDANKLFEKMKVKIYENFGKALQEKSKWSLDSVIHLKIHMVELNPLGIGSYIPLPEFIAKKNAIINMKNEDNECFKWSITRALNPKKDNPERITKVLREQSEELNWTGISFPTSLKDISKFESRNNDISVNIIGFERVFYPLRIYDGPKRKHEINLFLFDDNENQHFCWIKNLSRLVSKQSSKHDHHRHFCLRCLNSFHSEQTLEKHKELCNTKNPVKIVLPEKDKNILQFKNLNNSMKVPFVVYADFESFIEKIDTCQPDSKNSYTNQFQRHTPSGFCYLIKCFDDSIFKSKLVTFTKESEGQNVAQIFVNRLEKDVSDIFQQFKFPKKMIFTSKDKQQFENATHCHICGSPCDSSDKVRDHCHLSGRFRGAAHNECNLKFKVPKFIPVLFHNLSGYDSHLFIKNLGGDISCIPNNEEKYISFTKTIVIDRFKNKQGKIIDVKRDLRFIDSFKFMSTSLAKLASNLSPEKFFILKKFFPEEKKLDLVLRKGVYPYDYVDSLEKLNEKSLPPKEAFFSRLNDEHVSDEDYQHAQKVWKEFGLESLREYHDLYLRTDVFLLADVFENFRETCLNHYQLDPAWYYTTPGLAWDVALKKTKVELELLTDPDMILLFESGIRGGISTITTRYGNANNPYVTGFDESLPVKYLMDLDANNLYGWAMSKPLPTCGFKWMGTTDNWKNIPCILEVDLQYPVDLHDLHNDYPLAPERLEINKVEKLIPNLNHKRKYVVHHEALKLYESLGLKITKIHRGISFEESTWLKQYIDLNTNLRMQAKNDFEKNFFKLMNNSVFGKTMENIRNRVDVKLVTSRIKAVKLAAKPNFDRATIFDENLIAVHMKKTKLYFNKPIYLGMSILDLSKTLMYDFHYNYIKTKYPGKMSKLLFTDTDSLLYEIETKDFFKDINPDIESKFDTSDYPKDHPSGIKTGINKKVLGMMKDECKGQMMSEFVGLRAKLYSYKMDAGAEEKKCKGVKKGVVKKSITFEDYKKCLQTKVKQRRKMNVIRSHKHEIFTEEINKIALSAEDDKRVVLEDGIHTLAYGHYSIEPKN